jgi:hypothetical protein
MWPHQYTTAIQRGLEKGAAARKFKPVYCFEDYSAISASAPEIKPKPPAAAASSVAAAAPGGSRQREASAAPVVLVPAQVLGEGKGAESSAVAALPCRAKHQTWWWHNAREVGALEVGDADEDGVVHDDTPRSAMQTKLEGQQQSPARRCIAKHLGERAEPASLAGASAASSQETAIASEEEGVALINSFALAAAAKAAEAADVASASLGTHAPPGSSSTGGTSADLVYTATAVTTYVAGEGARGKAGGKGGDAKLIKVESPKPKAAVSSSLLAAVAAGAVAAGVEGDGVAAREEPALSSAEGKGRRKGAGSHSSVVVAAGGAVSNGGSQGCGKVLSSLLLPVIFSFFLSPAVLFRPPSLDLDSRRARGRW